MDQVAILRQSIRELADVVGSINPHSEDPVERMVFETITSTLSAKHSALRALQECDKYQPAH